MLDSRSWPGINRLAQPLCEAMIAEAASLRLVVGSGACGERLIDAGAATAGGLEAGRRMAEICLAGLGTVTLAANGLLPRWPLAINVHTSHPILACLASQYAGWSLSEGEGKGAYHVLGSGPGRAVAAREDLYKELGYRDTADAAVFVLETDTPPPAALVRRIADHCDLDPGRLSFIYAPTRSLAGTVQVVARVLEVALHKAHELKFPLADILDGFGVAPLPPPSPDFVTAMGRTNDAIIFGGHVQLYVNGSDDAAHQLAEKLPSRASADYGAPFAEVFKNAKYDFYAIDPMLFSPASVVVTALESGRSFSGGGLDADLVDKSFGG